MHLGAIPLKAMLAACLVVTSSLPATPRAPPRSPEEHARDGALFKRASFAMTPRVMQCFRRPAGRAFKPFRVSFFLYGKDRRPTLLRIVEEGTIGRAPRSRAEHAAIRAITQCAPYKVPRELRNWGFPGQVEFR
jgi:hypothetical protein